MKEKCHHCKTDVLFLSETCPSCGFPRSGEEESRIEERSGTKVSTNEAISETAANLRFGTSIEKVKERLGDHHFSEEVISKIVENAKARNSAELSERIRSRRVVEAVTMGVSLIIGLGSVIIGSPEFRFFPIVPFAIGLWIFMTRPRPRRFPK